LLHSKDNFAAHHYLVHTFENLGRAQPALEQSEEFVRLAPAIPHAHHMRGHELMRLGRTQEGIDEFRKADELENSYYVAEKIPATYDWHHAHNLSLLALCYESLGQLKNAERAFREAFLLPVYTDIAEFNRREWINFLLDRGRYNEALQASQTLIEQSSSAMGRFAGHTLSGLVLLSLDRLPDASAELELAEHELEHVPTSVLSSLPNAGVLRAEILLRQRKWTDANAALEHIEQTIQQMSGPDSWMEMLFELQSIARLAQQAGDWPLVEYTAKQMVEHDAHYAGSYYILGEVAEHAGDAAGARVNFKKASELWANADNNLPELISAHQKLGIPN
jgi:tetratricopeptide (TPR) repeat protein